MCLINFTVTNVHFCLSLHYDGANIYLFVNGTEIYKFKTKNADIDKYEYSGYRIGFDRRGSFSSPDGGYGQNVLIFGVDVSFSAHIDNKKTDILVLGIGPTQRLEHTLTAEKCILLILL